LTSTQTHILKLQYANVNENLILLDFKSV